MSTIRSEPLAGWGLEEQRENDITGIYEKPHVFGFQTLCICKQQPWSLLTQGKNVAVNR